MSASSFICSGPVRKLLLLLTSIVSSVLAGAKGKAPVNFVLINLDDSGYGDFSCYGATGYLTPNIDRMAAEGLRFTHFEAAQPVSGASRCALMTGCYPNRLGFRGAPGPGSKIRLNPEETTIAEMLRERGYATAAIGKWHLGDARQSLPLHHGFDEFYGLPYSNDMGPAHPTHPERYPDLPLYDGDEVIALNPDQSRLTGDYTERALDFIRRNRRGPFFLYLAHSMPHVPLAAGEDFKGKSGAGLYGDVMMELDWSTGRILDEIERLGLSRRTLVILTSDNGPWLNFGNWAGSAGGFREGKMTTWEGGNRVPCICLWKGRIRPGGVCNALAVNMDFLATFAELSGSRMPERRTDGVSLVPLLDDPAAPSPRKNFAYYYKGSELRAITDGRFKLVFPHEGVGYEGGTVGKDGKPGKTVRLKVAAEELYDLSTDPGERINVMGLYPERAAALREAAAAIKQDLGDSLTGVEGNGLRLIKQ